MADVFKFEPKPDYWPQPKLVTYRLAFVYHDMWRLDVGGHWVWCIVRKLAWVPDEPSVPNIPIRNQEGPQQ